MTAERRLACGMAFSHVRLNPGAGPAEESVTLTYSDGRRETLRLHDYERVYAVPGLYEEVVQRQLHCASPARVAEELLRESAAAGVAASELRVLDLAAGNGVSGAELARRGVGLLVAIDNIDAARAAAQRDRPALYAEYLSADVGQSGVARELVARHRLNCLVCVGALGHIRADAFDCVWGAFAPGAWLSVTLTDDPDSEQDESTAYLSREEREGRLQVLARARFLHRLAMSGAPIFHTSLVARRSQ